MKDFKNFIKSGLSNFFGRACLLMFALIGLIGCTDFVEVGPPKNTLVSKTVFEDPATVESALANLYLAMREQGLVSGNFGLTTRMGIYTDELDYFGMDPELLEFHQNRVLPHNADILTWWGQAYQVIYGANAIIEGLEDSTSLVNTDKDRYMGQAFFARAYMHSILVSLFGDVPYITTTDYTQNNKVSRLPQEEVYDAIITDLLDAINLLETAEVENEERVVPDHYVAQALLARMYLYTDQWELAESVSTVLIDGFDLEDNLNRVFLKESMETIWQLKPGNSPVNTYEAGQMIINAVPGQTYGLSEGLLAAFENGDGRKVAWIDSISNAGNTVTLSFSHKYKAWITETQSLEYSIRFRLAEQYLIRAEARVQSGDANGAQQDLNAVRNRAGLPNTTAVGANAVLDAIVRERRIELFTEQGHRFFDLKRLGLANAALGDLKPNWDPSDILLPIPEAELERNPNLLPQNDGY
ncbi:RagB/SusD family nutrient uptake outer membrane protein [Flagellimonas amoyensis]|uniref:RagB/SusD family nutrient uptake outer membrane protein n=1 Tax=Flagellimonas amoyensis TaxID=2169401 RepID=UPI001F1BE939|nr:RagB/SusD family nutrient uptake outer membrane protein [Allomuricauda amoyensis]